MNELDIIRKAKNLLTINGGVAWSGTAWKDVFGIFDIIFIAPDGTSHYYQVSTKDHRWSRMKKIDDWRAKHPMPLNSYLMLWNYKINDFEVEKL